MGVFDEKKSAFGGHFTIRPDPVSPVNAYGLIDREGCARSVNITVRSETPAQVDEAMEETRQVLRHCADVRPRTKTISTSSTARARSPISTR